MEPFHGDASCPLPSDPHRPAEFGLGHYDLGRLDVVSRTWATSATCWLTAAVVLQASFELYSQVLAIRLVLNLVHKARL